MARHSGKAAIGIFEATGVGSIVFVPIEGFESIMTNSDWLLWRKKW